MLSVTFSYCYAECRYAECHYAERSGARHNRHNIDRLLLLRLVIKLFLASISYPLPIKKERH
jgi:hypothetical protein